MSQYLRGAIDLDVSIEAEEGTQSMTGLDVSIEAEEGTWSMTGQDERALNTCECITNMREAVCLLSCTS